MKMIAHQPARWPVRDGQNRCRRVKCTARTLQAMNPIGWSSATWSKPKRTFWPTPEVQRGEPDREIATEVPSSCCRACGEGGCFTNTQRLSWRDKAAVPGREK
jgi:hypothetical protein